MALITCPKCGMQVLDDTEVCVHCGAPRKEIPSSGPVYVSVPQVSTLTGKGTVYFNGKSESCARGGTVCICISGPTEITVKMSSYFGKPTMLVNPGDKIQVSVSILGKISLSKVPTLGTNFSKNW